jgi:putative nucleotidyltransferase with HDIG domain
MTLASEHDNHRIDIDRIVDEIKDLPSLPAIVMELLSSIDEEDIDIAVLAKKVALDQALSAKTLRFANSPFFGMQARVTSIQQAIALIGVQSVRNLVIAAAVAGCFPEQACANFNYKAFWRHSIATAVCGKVLARHLHVNQDYAFTGGLLHDIGRLVFVTRFPHQYEAVLAHRAANDRFILDAEHSVMGTDHVMAGAALALHWNFSETIQHAIERHHDFDTLDGGSLASIIHAADAIVHALDLSGAEDDIVPPVSAMAWNSLGMDEATYMRIFRETELEFQEISQVLLV